MKVNKTNDSKSYSNLHYSYFNPFSSVKNYNNKFKRQRIKDKYSDIAIEKRDFVSFEISQKDVEKLNSQSTIDKTKSHYSKSFKSKSQILKSEKIYYNLKRMSHHNKVKKFEIKKLETKPYSTFLRSQSAIINKSEIKNKFDKNKIFNNHNKSRQKKIPPKNINFLESYKIDNKTKIIFDDKDSPLSSTMKEFVNLNDNQENKNDNYEENKNNDKSLKKSDDISYDKENKNKKIINNKNSNLINNSKNIIRKINFEENKNNKINDKIKNKNKIYNSIKKIGGIIENKSFKILPNKNIYKRNNLKQRLLKKSVSCPAIVSKIKNEEIIKFSDEFQIDENYLLKENIHKILKSDRKYYKENKKFYDKKFKKSIYIKDDEYNDNKLKKLLSKIPNHNGKEGLKKYPDFMKISKRKNINLVEKYGSIKNVKNIMPPNNLEEIIFKKQLDFFNNYN